MKKLALTFAIVLGLGLTSFANPNGGLFNRAGNTPTGNESGYNMNRPGGGGSPMLPGHGENTNQPAPLGSGALLLMGFGAAYAMSKRNKKD